MKRLQAMLQRAIPGKKKKKVETGFETSVAFGDLPEDVLCELFQRIESLPLRFSLAGVNRKFRKLMLKEIRKPMPLHLNMQTVAAWRLNGHKIPPRKWPRAIRILAQKTQFTEIVLSGEYQISNAVYMALFSSLPSLEKLLIFQCDAAYTSDWWPNRIFKLIKNAPKLSILTLDLSNFTSAAEQLIDALSNRGLTQIDLNIQFFEQRQMIELFQCIQPSMLKRVSLVLNLIGLVWQWQQDFGDIFGILRKDAWAELETISLDFGSRGWSSLPVRDSFFKTLGEFTRLRECSTTLDYRLQQQFNNDHTPSTDKLAIYIAIYLKHSACSPHKRTFYCHFSHHHAFPIPEETDACLMADVLKRVQTTLPDVDFSYEIKEIVEIGPVVSISVTLQNATFKLLELRLYDCQCDTCRGFYPVLLMEVKSGAKQMTSGYLENYRLDRCKIGRLVNDLNGDGNSPLALSALTNHNATVSVSFESGSDAFVITVDTDHCFSDACIGCVVV